MRLLVQRQFSFRLEENQLCLLAFPWCSLRMGYPAFAMYMLVDWEAVTCIRKVSNTWHSWKLNPYCGERYFSILLLFPSLREIIIFQTLQLALTCFKPFLSLYTESLLLSFRQHRSLFVIIVLKCTTVRNGQGIYHSDGSDNLKMVLSSFSSRCSSLGRTP